MRGAHGASRAEEEVSKPKIIGGPEMKAFYRENVIPHNFSSEDPFWDIPGVIHGIDRDCKSGKTLDLVIIERDDSGVHVTWRGRNPMTTALGMLEYAKGMLQEGV